MGTKTKKVSLREVGRRTDMYILNPKDIKINWDDNPRKDYGGEDFDNLVESIKEHGVKTPIKVIAKDGEFWLSHGFRRMKAVNKAIEDGVEITGVYVQLAKNQEESLIDHFVLNSGKPMNPAEKAEGIVRYMAMTKCNQAETAKKLGMHQSQVSLYILFAENASTQVKRAVEDQKLTFSGAMELVKNTDDVMEQNKILNDQFEKVKETGVIVNSVARNNKKRKRKINAKSVKKATGAQTLTPFERVLDVADKLENTPLGDQLQTIIQMIRRKADTKEIIDNVNDFSSK